MTYGYDAVSNDESLLFKNQIRSLFINGCSYNLQRAAAKSYGQVDSDWPSAPFNMVDWSVAVHLLGYGINSRRSVN